MSEKWYVVSESELEALRHAWTYEMTMKAEAACRARPVPEWSTHFTTPTDGAQLCDEERGLKFEEIRR